MAAGLAGTPELLGAAPSSFTSPATSHSAASATLPVDAALVKELRELLVRSTPGSWHAISDLYTEIAMVSRRAYVRPHKTLVNVLRRAQAEGQLGIHINATGTHYATGDVAPRDATVDAPSPSQSRSEPSSSSPSPADRIRTPKPAKSTAPTFRPDSIASGNSGGGGGGMGPGLYVDFYYDAGLRAYPPPPPDFDITPSSLQVAKATEDGAVMTLKSFVAFIPPFFVPMADVLAHMPGYAEEHLENYFRTSAMEIVKVGGRRFVRLFGGYAALSLEGCEVAEETFEQYRPDVSLVEAFAAAFDGVTDQWMSLSQLLSRADPQAVMQLPFQGPEAIVYFAQMQHRFNFSVGHGGEGSVLLLRRGAATLSCNTTPTPKSCNHLLSRVPTDGGVDVTTLQAQAPAHILAEISNYYGNLPAFFRAHAPVFHLSQDSAVVVRASYHRRLQVAALPLEEQLQLALQQKDKKRIRAIRRRIAFRDNPSHPFHDPDNLAQELGKYLPHHGFVPLRTFLKKNVPEELLNYMPTKIHNFFSNYPQYFRQFEYQQAGTWCVMRPGQQLPRGVIRHEFAEADLVALVAEYVQMRGTGRSSADIYLHLPRGAQEAVRKRHGGLYHFIVKYPQYFNVVLGSDAQNNISSAIVHLIQLPPASAPSLLVDDENGCEVGEEGRG